MKAFLNHIEDVVFATNEQRSKEIWDVEGRLKNGNQIFKFDIRPLVQADNKSEKVGFFHTKADKIVFELEDKWIVFDTEELHDYIKKHEKLDFNADELLENLTWNLKIDK